MRPTKAVRVLAAGAALAALTLLPACSSGSEHRENEALGSKAPAPPQKKKQLVDGLPGMPPRPQTQPGTPAGARA